MADTETESVNTHIPSGWPVYKKLAVLGFALLGLISQLAVVCAEATLRELPPLLRAVSDEVGVLSAAEGLALSRMLDDIEKKTKVKIIVLVAETTQPESVEAYVQRLVDHWRDRTDALQRGRFVFVVVAKNDRVVRVVPGEKLISILKPFEKSGATTEALTQLKQGKYYEGLTIIVNKLAQLIPKLDGVV